MKIVWQKDKLLSKESNKNIAQHIMLITLCKHNMLCFLLTFIWGNVTLLAYAVPQRAAAFDVSVFNRSGGV